MSEIIDFAERKITNEPHMTGPAVCLGCHHEFTQVAPQGVVVTECPNCHTQRAVWAGFCTRTAHEKDGRFQCRCGCYVFVIMRDWKTTVREIRCVMCGEVKPFGEVFG